MMDDDDHSFEHSFDARVAERAPGGDVEALLRHVHELIDTARPELGDGDMICASGESYPLEGRSLVLLRLIEDDRA